MTYRITVTTEYTGQSAVLAEDKARMMAQYAYLTTGNPATANIEVIDDKEQGASA